MKNKNELTALMIAITLVFSALGAKLAVAQTPAISKAEAVELAVHRIERLITLSRLEKDFGAKLESLTLMTMPATTDADVAFMVTATQFAVSGTTLESALLNLTNSGKMLSFTTNQDNAVSQATAFPDKDAATLLELSLHKLEADATDSLAAPFYKDLASVKLIPVMMDMGQGLMMMSVTVSMTSSSVSTTLVYQLALDGTVTGRFIQ